MHEKSHRSLSLNTDPACGMSTQRDGIPIDNRPPNIWERTNESLNVKLGEILSIVRDGVLVCVIVAVFVVDLVLAVVVTVEIVVILAMQTITADAILTEITIHKIVKFNYHVNRNSAIISNIKI